MSYLQFSSVSYLPPARFLSVALFLFSFCASTTAAPKISSVSATDGVNDLQTIYGSSFGEKEATFNLKDDAHEYTHVNKGDFLSGLSQDSLWAVKGSSWATPLATHHNENTGNYFYFGEAKSYNQWIEPLQSQSNKSIYVSWLFNPSESPSSQEGSNKFIRIWDHSSGGNTRISWTQMHLTYVSNDIGHNPGPSWAHWGGKENNWNLMEIWVDGEAGTIEARTNGNITHKVSDFKKSPINEGLNIKLLGFDPNETSRYSNLTFMIDDLYISTDRARVLVSPASEWSEARRNGTPQQIKNWNNSSIQFYLDAGRHTGAEKLFLYAVDRAGNVNNEGFLVCSKCPLAPEVVVE